MSECKGGATAHTYGGTPLAILVRLVSSTVCLSKQNIWFDIIQSTIYPKRKIVPNEAYI